MTGAVRPVENRVDDSIAPVESVVATTNEVGVESSSADVGVNVMKACTVVAAVDSAIVVREEPGSVNKCVGCYLGDTGLTGNCCIANFTT